MHDKSLYSQLPLSRSRRDPLKLFKISVLWHIKFAELRKIQIEQPNFTNKYVIWLLKIEIYTEKIVESGNKLLWKRGEIAPQRGEIAPEEQVFLLSTIFCYLMLDFYINRRTRFSLRDPVIWDNQNWDNEGQLYLIIVVQVITFAVYLTWNAQCFFCHYTIFLRL